MDCVGFGFFIFVCLIRSRLVLYAVLFFVHEILLPVLSIFSLSVFPDRAISPVRTITSALHTAFPTSPRHLPHTAFKLTGRPGQPFGKTDLLLSKHSQTPFISPLTASPTQNRHHQSPAPNNEPVQLRARLRQKDPRPRRAARFLQRHSHPADRHRRMRLGPVRRLPLRAPTPGGIQPHQTHHHIPVPIPRKTANIHPILPRRRLRRPNQLPALRPHRARPHPPADATARVTQPSAPVQRTAGLHPQADLAVGRGPIPRPVPRAGGDGAARGAGLRRLVPHL
jgi:hypothetical protein